MPGKRIQLTWPSDPTRDAPVRHRRACSYEAFIPDDLRTLAFVLTPALAGQISEAEQEVRLLNDEGGDALGPLARLLLRTESIASSKIEGLQIDTRRLARGEAKADAGAAPGPAVREIVANISAMTLALGEASGTDAFGRTHLLAIHRRLMEQSRPRLAGRFRTSQNWIGGNDYTPCGADFVPPPVDELRPLLADLYDAMNDDGLSPLVQAALVHAQFETLHPFDDGNGRTGRALVHVILRRRGIAPRFTPPISVVFANARERYIDGLDAFRRAGVTEWISLFATAMTHSARMARGYLRRVIALQERWRLALRSSSNVPRADATAWTIIDALPAHPVISATVAADVTGRSMPRVYEALGQLTESGVLEPLTTGKRNRLWEAAGLLDLIEQLT